MEDAAGYAARLAAENRRYRDDVDVHKLPGIFHYWSNRYVRPKLEAFGFSTPEQMFRKYAGEQFRLRPNEAKRLVSFGAGNCNLEIDVALDLRAQGYSDFAIDCIDLNEAMLERGRASAVQHDVRSHLNFVQADFNEWIPGHAYDAVLANQALHHVLKLEDLFGRIKGSLKPGGTLIVSDMVGRNGHLRWPEALDIVREFWRRMPPSYRFNRKLERYEEMYINYDCSDDGFEGIRSQDILPLLIENFHFQLFIAFANVIEPFVDRAFGYHFDSGASWDCEFIDAVHRRDEAEFAAGRLKPTHILAVLGTDPGVPLLFHAPLTPEFCVRDIGQPLATPKQWPNSYEWRSWPQSTQTELETACERLDAAYEKLKEAELKIRERGEMVMNMTAAFEERTKWVLQLKQEVKEWEESHGHLEHVNTDLKAQADWALQLKEELEQLRKQFEERTRWALQLERDVEAQTARSLELRKDLEQLEWARPLDRRFHRVLSKVFQMIRRVRGRQTLK